MVTIAKEGAVYKIDLVDGKPAHYWIVLNEPNLQGEFLAVSFTDRHNFKTIPDVWAFGIEICPGFKLAKPSVMALPYAQVRRQVWLDQFSAELIGQCNQASLIRARCNICWYREHLRPHILSFANFYLGEWKPLCGNPPQNTSTVEVF